MSENLNKKDIIKQISSKTGFSSNFTKKVFNDLIYLLSHNIKTGYFSLKNVGSFKLIDKKDRIGRNPKTRKEFVISRRKSISFTISTGIEKNLKKLI